MVRNQLWGGRKNFCQPDNFSILATIFAQKYPKTSRMKKHLLAVTLMFSGLLAFGQQDPQFSQNMHNRLFPNPGVAGSNDAICASLLGRQQWVGFEGRPETYLLSVHAPVKMLRGGVGLSLYGDRLGNESNAGAKLAYAYRLKGLGTGTLGIGIAIGFQNKSLSNNWDAIDGTAGDVAIPNGTSVSDFAIDGDFGLYYKIPGKLYLGLSATHLAEQSWDQSGGTGASAFSFGYQAARHYYIQAGYTHELTSTLDLKPSVFVKSDGSIAQFDLNVGVEWNKMLYGGVSYRLQDAIVPMLGLRKEMGDCTLNIGYSYDVTTSLLRQHSTGSHELFLGICCKLAPPPKVQKHKTVRFL